MAAKDAATPTLDLAIEAATFYGGLVSNGVPPTSAVSITSSYVQAALFARLSGDQKPRHPWEDS